MKIQRIETFTARHVGFVRVTAEGGQQGWGQVSTYHSDISAAVLHRQVAPYALGHDIDDLATLVALIPEREHKFPGSYLPIAIGGLDTAVFDLLAKREDKSVCEYLGGIRRPMRIYGSSMRRDITPKDEAERLKRLPGEYGFDAFKIRVGREYGHDEDQWPGRSETVIETVRTSLGDDVTILADANSCFTPKRAIEIGRILEDNGYSHFEEPCPYWELECTKEVRDTLEIDISRGEQDCNLVTWRRIGRMAVVDIKQPEICYPGGITCTLRVADIAKQHDLACTPHSANHSLVTLFTLHLMAAIESAGPYVEFTIEAPDYYPWEPNLFRPTLVPVDGKVTIPDAPGWGVEINQSWLECADVTVSALD